MGRLLDGTFHEARINLPLAPHFLGNLVRHPINWVDHALRLASSTEPLEVAHRVAVPTLIAWGKKDHTFPPECAERLDRAIPRSRIAWSESSHDWLILHPNEFAAAVVGFAREEGLLGS
jgi:pimeloyl-ACP methyl ester carboxylesterase